MFNEFEIRIIALLVALSVLFIFAIFISKEYKNFSKFLEIEKQKELQKEKKLTNERLFSLTQKEDDERE